MVKEFISKLPPDKLTPFKKHPYQVREDVAMDELVESVRTYGILSPLLARPKGEGYELVSGHRRRLAAQKLDEELGHLEMVGTIVHQLTRNLTEEQIKEAGFEAYFVDHTTGVFPQFASGYPWSASTMQEALEVHDLARTQEFDDITHVRIVGKAQNVVIRHARLLFHKRHPRQNLLDVFCCYGLIMMTRSC